MHSLVKETSVDKAQAASEVGTSTGNLAQSTSCHRSFYAYDTIATSVIRFNANHIFVANVDGTTGVYDIETGQLRKRLIGHTSGVSTLQCTGQTLFSGSSDRTIRIWDLTTMKLRHILRGHQATVSTMHVLDLDLNQVNDESEYEHQVMVTGSGDSTIRVWRLPEEDEDAQPSSSKLGLTTDILDDTANHDTPRTLDSTRDRHLLHTCRGHSAAIRATVVKGGRCISGSEDKTVRVWNIASGQCEHVLEGHTDLVASVAYDHDRHIALSGSGVFDGTIRVWDVLDGTCLAILPDHDAHITHLRFDRDTFISAATGSVKVWDTRTHTLRRSMSSSLYVKSLTVDSGRVMSSGGGVVRIWDPSSGVTIWQTDIGRPVRKVEWKGDRLVVLSMVQGPKSQAPRIDVYDLAWI